MSEAPAANQTPAASIGGEAIGAAGCTATRHGTRAAYVAGCRCPEARKANREYAKYRDRRTAHAAFGGAAPFTVPVQDATAVLNDLRQSGWTLRRIEAVTGIKRDHLARINGKTCRPLQRVRWTTYQTLCALLEQEAPVAAGTLVDATATWQRIHGLIALGYPKAWIAQQLGIGRALQLRDQYVTQRNAEKVRALADRYGATRGPSEAARRYAAAHGWTPDLLWQADDAAELDGRGDLDPVVVERLVNGEHVDANRPERLEAFRQLLNRGHALNDAARRLGINGKYARKYADTTTRKEGAA